MIFLFLCVKLTTIRSVFCQQYCGEACKKQIYAVWELRNWDKTKIFCSL